MSVTISRADVDAINRAATIALSPLEYDSACSWGAALTASLEALLGADQSLSSITDNPGFGVIGRGARCDEAIASYLAHYHTLDEGLNEIRRERRLEVYDQRALYSPEYFESPVFRELREDWLRPNELMDAIGIGIDAPKTPLPVAIHLYHATDSRPKFGDRGVLLLQLMLPAFKAGVRSQLALAERRHDFSRMIDASAVAVMVVAGGRVLHESAACQRMLRDDAEAARVRAQIQGVACRPNTGMREIRTTANRYRLIPSRLGPGTITRSECIAITIERVHAAPLSDAELRAQFRLTPREIEVARLLAAGLQNRDIATQLAMRPNTAWRHTERVLAKLGVHNRSAVAPVLCGARTQGT
jgi:DNA-binding NarL/FixJ family response regulator